MVRQWNWETFVTILYDTYGTLARNMMTLYKGESSALFSGDGFGCFGALNGGIIDKTSIQSLIG